MAYQKIRVIEPENGNPGPVTLIVSGVDMETTENLDFPLPGNWNYAIERIRAVVRTAPSAVTTKARVGLSKVVSGTASVLRGSVALNAVAVSAMDDIYTSNGPSAGVVYYENVAAATTSGVITQVSNLTAAGTATLATSPLKTPRKLVVTLSDAAGANLAGTVTITGTTNAGDRVVEVVTVVAGTTSYTTVNAYASLTSITYDFSSASGGTGAASDTLDVGMATSIGLPGRYTEATLIVAAGTVEAASSSDVPAGTFIPTTAANGTNDYTIAFRNHTAVDSIAPGGTLRIAITGGTVTGEDVRDLIVDLFRW